jgi:hypothetical protein
MLERDDRLVETLPCPLSAVSFADMPKDDLRRPLPAPPGSRKRRPALAVAVSGHLL